MATVTEFQWIEPGVLVDGDLELVLVDKTYDSTPTYKFEMRRLGVPGRIGYIDLRIGTGFRNWEYEGNVAFSVKLEYRGHRYAGRACRLILPFAKLHGLSELWLTCSPENSASRQVCQTLGAELTEIVDIPEGIDPQQRGHSQMCRYRLSL